MAVGIGGAGTATATAAAPLPSWASCSARGEGDDDGGPPEPIWPCTYGLASYPTPLSSLQRPIHTARGGGQEQAADGERGRIHAERCRFVLAGWECGQSRSGHA
jgi:hypothetical protein